MSAGLQLGPYRLVRELGRGSTGIAYLAEDRRSPGVPVCAKVIHPQMAMNPDVIERFRREIVLTRRIKHPGVCRLFGLYQESGRIFIAMELAPGASLHERMKHHAQLPIADVIAIGSGICAALTAAHDVGVIHRDLKPGNVMVDEGFAVKLLDFGLATAMDLTSVLTRPGSIIGTRSYIAPEVWLGAPASPKSDQYALGVILYKAVTGQLPYPQKDAFLLDAMTKTAPPKPSELRPDVPPILESMIMRVLAAQPEHRFEDVRALGLVLERLKTLPLARTPRPAPAFAALDDVAAGDLPTVPISTPMSQPLSQAPSPDAAPLSAAEAFAAAALADLPDMPTAPSPGTPPRPRTIPAPAVAFSAAPAQPPGAAPAARAPDWADDDVESGSWVVNGQAVGPPVQPKVMTVPVKGISSELEPEDLPIWQAPARASPLPWLLGLLAVVGIAAGAWIWHSHAQGAQPATPAASSSP